MSFLQPIMLFAVPLIALPVIIHLINQRRYQTMRWGAMRFLLAANRMSRGYARIRQWLILACRTLAMAGLILAACRPLASGMLGALSGGRADTTIVVFDRSPSMSQRGNGSSLTKLRASQQELAATLSKLGSNHWVLIESDRCTPRPLDSVDRLLDLPETAVSSATADLPKMLAAAASYMETHKTGRTEIWICSDLRANDWQHRNGQWQQLRDRFLAFPQSVRFHLFAYPQPAADNLAVEVTELERQSSSSGSELALSLRVTRETSTLEPISIPLQFEIEGARSQTRIELTGDEVALRGHRIPIESTLEKGFGWVSIPTDVNAADDIYYFAFDKPQPRRSVLVLEDLVQGAALQLAVEVPPRSSISCEVEAFTPQQLDGVAWEHVALVLWQAALPSAEAAELLNQFIDRGGQVIFFPPATVESPTSFRGVAWTGWREPAAAAKVATWTTDQDLLENSLGGLSLPVGELQTFRCCVPQGDLTPLATLEGGLPLWSRLPSTAGGVYFCSTTANPRDSTLADNGIVLYVAAQRALARGAALLGRARQTRAGDEAVALQDGGWKQLAGSSDALSTDYGFRGGVYERAGHLVAVNRFAAEEDHAATLTAEQVHGLFEGLDFSLVENTIGSSSSLVQEIWRAFLLAMIVALLVEALLCVPSRGNPADDRNAMYRERHERAAVLKEMRAA